jgi:hypothetical protein
MKLETGGTGNSPGFSDEHAFKAMVAFTMRIRDLGWPSLPGLLGGAQIIDGRPSDPGVEDDWSEVITTLGIEDHSSHDSSLSPQTAYEVIFRFLTIQFRRRGLESVGDVVRRLGADASSEQAREVAEDWQDALMGS